jgi:hypothetical protein
VKLVLICHYFCRARGEGGNGSISRSSSKGPCISCLPRVLRTLLLFCCSRFCTSLTPSLSSAFDFCAVFSPHDVDIAPKFYLQETRQLRTVDGLEYGLSACMVRHYKFYSKLTRSLDVKYQRTITDDPIHASHLRDQSVQAYCGEHDAEIFWGIDNRKTRCETMLLSALCHSNGPTCGMSL